MNLKEHSMIGYENYRAPKNSQPEAKLYNPCRKLALAVLHRALVDALMTNKHTLQHQRREARAWLLSESKETYSAQWWSEMAEIEHVLSGLRMVVTCENPEDFIEKIIYTL